MNDCDCQIRLTANRRHVWQVAPVNQYAGQRMIAEKEGPVFGLFD